MPTLLGRGCLVLSEPRFSLLPAVLWQTVLPGPLSAFVPCLLFSFLQNPKVSLLGKQASGLLSPWLPRDPAKRPASDIRYRKGNAAEGWKGYGAMVPAGNPSHHRSSPAQGGHRKGPQKRGRRPGVPALPVAEPSLGRGWCWAAEGDGGTLSPSHALSTRSEVQLPAGEARAGPSPHPHERGGHTAAQGGNPQPEPLLRTEREITETLGRVPEAHEGSVRRGEGQCPDRGSGMEKPSSARGRQCPQRLGSRGPARLPQPGTPAPARLPRHCRPASVISESVLIDPLPAARGVGGGQRLCLIALRMAMALTRSLQHQIHV